MQTLMTLKLRAFLLYENACKTKSTPSDFRKIYRPEILPNCVKRNLQIQIDVESENPIHEIYAKGTCIVQTRTTMAPKFY